MAAFKNTMRKRTISTMYQEFDARMTYLTYILPEARGNIRDNEPIKAKALFMHSSLRNYGWRYAIGMRALIFPRLRPEAESRF